ncbi:MAG: hypothetical protein MZV49_11660 [Rhodopseudomonas palustris]|nr:hypothetical protein [Rhodopseudomonas palustris]
MVDASQGVEAQTLANVYQALDSQPRDRAGAQQDRPAGRRAGTRQAADRGRDRPRRLRRGDDLGQDRPRRRPTCWRRSSRACRRRKGDRNAPLKALLVDSWYDAYLGVVVLVRVIDGVLKKGQRIRMMAHRRAPTRSSASACFTPKHDDVGRARPRRGRLHHRRDQGSGRYAASATPSPTTSSRPTDAAAGLQAGACRWCSAACSRSMPTTSRTCATRWASCASTTPASPSRWKPRRRSASASAAASSACCTSRSSRSGWSASSIST